MSMQVAPPSTGGGPKVPPKVIALAAVIIGLAALIAYLLGPWSPFKGTGDGQNQPAGNGATTAPPSGYTRGPQIKVLKTGECVLGADTGACADICERALNGLAKDAVLELDVSVGQAEATDVIERCIKKAGYQYKLFDQFQR